MRTWLQPGKRSVQMGTNWEWDHVHTVVGRLLKNEWLTASVLSSVGLTEIPKYLGCCLSESTGG